MRSGHSSLREVYKKREVKSASILGNKIGNEILNIKANLEPGCKIERDGLTNEACLRSVELWKYSRSILKPR